MVESNIPEINVDEIMKKIREEVNKKKAWQNSFTYKFKFKFRKYISKYHEYFLLEDFLKYNGEEFVKHAYLEILKRTPDPEGFNYYFSELKNNSLNKIEILGQIRYSKEGRGKKVCIKGLLLRFVINTSYRLPLVGYALRLSTGILQLPKILRNIEHYKNYTDQRFEQSNNTLLNKADVQIVEHKADAQVVQQLSHELEKKADTRTVEQLSHELEKKADAQVVQTDINNIIQQIRDQKLNILSQQKNLASLIERLNQKMSEAHTVKEQKGLTEEQTHHYDALYVSFEDRFRGTQADIKERQRVYLPYIQEALKNTDNAPVLDVGCGRGEWLELLKESRINAKGVDINRIMVTQAKELGLDVEEADVVEYLKSQKTNSLSAITGFHIIEHLPFEVMIKLFDESLRLLKASGIVIFETPNPENLIVGACNFYMDPTHRNPIPPLTSSFLLESRGFVDVVIKRVNENKEIHYEDKFINHIFAVGQDYAVIGKKS